PTLEVESRSWLCCFRDSLRSLLSVLSKKRTELIAGNRRKGPSEGLLPPGRFDAAGIILELGPSLMQLAGGKVGPGFSARPCEASSLCRRFVVIANQFRQLRFRAPRRSILDSIDLSLKLP